jgi:hypothetical protein
MSAVYVGCGSDVLPVLALGSRDFIKRWIYIDSQPKSEFGHMEMEGGGFERPNYIFNVRKALQGLGFKESFQDKEHLEFIQPDTRVELSFWPNTALPLKNPSNVLLKELALCTNVIICGHDPHESLLPLLSPGPKRFITDFKTVLLDPMPDGVIQHGKDKDTFNSFLRIDAARDIKAMWHLWEYTMDHKSLLTVTTHETWEQVVRAKHPH